MNDTTNLQTGKSTTRGTDVRMDATTNRRVGATEIDDHVIFAIETATGLPIDLILSNHRKYNLVLARSVLVNYYHREKYTDGQIEQLIGRERTTVIHSRMMQSVYLTIPLYKKWHEAFYEILAS